jgi:hypothetical protein
MDGRVAHRKEPEMATSFSELRLGNQKGDCSHSRRTKSKLRERCSRPSPAKYFLAILCAILLVASDVRATSIVILTTKHGIVIGADGKIVIKHSNGNLYPPSSTIGTKVVLFGNRIVVAESGTEYIKNGTITRYSFASFVDSLQSDISPDTTVTDLVAIIKIRLSKVFNGFDVMLKNGKLTKGDLAPLGDALLRFYVVGYEKGHPLGYTVQLPIDWTALHLKTPIEQVIYPNPIKKNLTITWTGGDKHGIIDLKNGVETIQTRIAAKQVPVELKALGEDLDVSFDRTLVLARVLLNLEVDSNPCCVGYPLTIFTISPDKVRKHTYENAQQQGDPKEKHLSP